MFSIFSTYQEEQCMEGTKPKRLTGVMTGTFLKEVIMAALTKVLGPKRWLNKIRCKEGYRVCRLELSLLNATLIEGHQLPVTILEIDMWLTSTLVRDTGRCLICEV